MTVYILYMYNIYNILYIYIYICNIMYMYIYIQVPEIFKRHLGVNKKT